jgi:hypothetical protein
MCPTIKMTVSLLMTALGSETPSSLCKSSSKRLGMDTCTAIGVSFMAAVLDFDGPAFRNLNSVLQADKVRIAPDLKDPGVLPTGGQDANAVADFETASPDRSGCCILSIGRGWGL